MEKRGFPSPSPTLARSLRSLLTCTHCSAGQISTVPPRKTSDLLELLPYRQSLPAWRYATGRWAGAPEVRLT